MINVIKSEIRKVTTVRSAYVIAGIILLLVPVFTVINLFQLDLNSVVDASALQQSLYAGISITAQIAAIFAILLMGHEYRHNLIFHTFTTIRSRFSILLAKMISVVGYSLVVGAMAVLLSYVLGSFAIDMIVDNPPVQSVAFMRVIPVGILYISSFALIGLLLTVFFRTIVAPIVILILTPGTFEPLLGLLLDDYAKYLPFTSLQQLVIPGVDGSLLQALITISTYLVVGYVIGWRLFVTRDASKQ